MARTYKHNLGDPARAEQARRLITSYLETQSEPVGSTQIIDTIEPQLTNLGLTKPGGYFHVKAMAKNGLIYEVHTGVRNRRLFSLHPFSVVPRVDSTREPISEHVKPHEEEHIVKQARKRAAKAANKSGEAGRAAANAKAWDRMERERAAVEQREKWEHIIDEGLPNKKAAPERLPFGEPSGSTEVELVVAGVTIIVGRNPATGRPRITIE
jgi:hypothetical protein